MPTLRSRVPTVFVGDETFVWNDRFELAKAYIQKANGSPGVGRRAALP